jgi:uridine kinase
MHYRTSCGLTASDADVRLAWRIRRDTLERGRDVAGVIEHYAKFVKPAFDDFVLPTKMYADVIKLRGREKHVSPSRGNSF